MTESFAGLGMSLPEILVVLGAVGLVLARWLPPGARRPTTVTAGAVVVVSTVVLVVVGVRWQLVPVLVGAAVMLALAVPALVRRRNGRPAWRARWWLALPGTVACLLLIATGPVAAWALPVPVFPLPSGQLAVGTTVLQWTDPDRPETATPAPDDHRTVVVQLWYPARPSAAGAEPARYGGRNAHEAHVVFGALADYLGVPGFLLDGAAQARTRSVPDAAVADTGARFPVVLFSPGLGGVRAASTAARSRGRSPVTSTPTGPQ